MQIRISQIFLALAILTFGSVVIHAKSPQKKSVDWVKMARNLTGESESVRQKSLKRLRAMKDLDQVLTAEIEKPAFENGKLNTQRFLALDIVTALKRKSLMPVLISQSLADATASIYHTMNTLMTSQNVDSMMTLYHDRLLSYPSSNTVKIALLDTLGRTGFELSLAELRYLNRNASFEVQSGILSYMRGIMFLKNRLLYQNMMSEIMIAGSFEIRMQTLFLYEELLSQKKLKLKDASLQCLQDTNKAIQNFCKKLVGSYS